MKRTLNVGFQRRMRIQRTILMFKNAILRNSSIFKRSLQITRQRWDKHVQSTTLHHARHLFPIIPNRSSHQTKRDMLPIILSWSLIVVWYFEAQTHLIEDIAKRGKCMLVVLVQAGENEVIRRGEEFGVPALCAHYGGYGCAGHDTNLWCAQLEEMGNWLVLSSADSLSLRVDVVMGGFARWRSNRFFPLDRVKVDFRVKYIKSSCDPDLSGRRSCVFYYPQNTERRHKRKAGVEPRQPNSKDIEHGL